MYKNVNMTQSVNFNPPYLKEPLVFTKKNKEVHKDNFMPDRSDDKKFVADSGAYMLDTHYKLGSNNQENNTEKQGSFKSSHQPAYIEAMKNNKVNDYMTKDEREQHFTLKTSNGNSLRFNWYRNE